MNTPLRAPSTRAAAPPPVRPPVPPARPLLAMPPAMLLLSLAAATLLLAAAPAPLSGQVSDRELEHPPYYAGRKAADTPPAVGHFPVLYQVGAEHEALFDPPGSEGTAVAALLRAMNEYLDGLGATVAIRPGPPPPGSGPDVSFGCPTDPSGECIERDDETAPARAGTRMRLAVTGPSRAWRRWAADALAGAGVDAAVVLTLEVGQYWMRQRGLRGAKVVELGSDHEASLPWLTSLETPVTVLQVTGALVDREGRVRRIGAEGLIARRTAFRLSVLGAQELITDEDVEAVRAGLREDLPGHPVGWKVALRRMLEELTGRAAPPEG